MGGATETFNSKGLPDYSTPYQVTITNMPRIQVSEILHHGAYVTDQFKAGKRVTLNVGLRWDYYSSAYRNANLRSDCQFCGYFYQGQALPNGATLPVDTALVNGGFPDKTVSTFPARYRAPRIGVAYDLFGKGRTMLKLELRPVLQLSFDDDRGGREPGAVGHGDLHLEQSHECAVQHQPARSDRGIGHGRPGLYGAAESQGRAFRRHGRSDSAPVGQFAVD